MFKSLMDRWMGLITYLNGITGLEATPDENGREWDRITLSEEVKIQHDVLFYFSWA